MRSHTLLDQRPHHGGGPESALEHNRRRTPDLRTCAVYVQPVTADVDQVSRWRKGEQIKPAGFHLVKCSCHRQQDKNPYKGQHQPQPLLRFQESTVNPNRQVLLPEIPSWLGWSHFHYS